MVSLKRKTKKGDSERLLQDTSSSKRSIFPKKPVRSEDYGKSPKRMSLFRKREASEDYQTPPSTPEASETPLNVAVVTTSTAMTPVRANKDSKTSTTTASDDDISDLSASVIRQTYSSPVKDTTPMITNDSETAMAERQATTCVTQATQNILNNVMNMVDDACVGSGPPAVTSGTEPPPVGLLSVKTPPTSNGHQAPPTWGVAPSTDDEDEEEEEETMHTSTVGDYMTLRTRDDTRGDSMTFDSTTRETRSSSVSAPDPKHDNFELVLQEAVETPPPAAGPRKKKIKWRKSFVERPRFRRKEPAAETTEMVVRIPETVEPIPDEELIGEDHMNDDVPREVRSPSPAVEVRSPSPAVEAHSPVPTEIERLPEKPAASKTEEPPRSRSWSVMVHKLAHLIKHDNAKTTPQATNATEDEAAKEEMARSMSSPMRLITRATTPKQSKPEKAEKPTEKQAKPVWKTAKDPKTGREYYYHRLTRKTTWTKPPELLEAEKEETKEEIAPVEQEYTKEEEPVEQVLPEETESTAEASDGNGPESTLRKKSPRDFDPEVWQKKEEIEKLLYTMKPPTRANVDELMSKYEGKEDVLLHQLRDMSESQPFDEPAGDSEIFSKASSTSASPRLSPVTLRSRTRTAVTKNSEITDTTQKIRNTGGLGKPIAFDPITELKDDEPLSTATSISSHNLESVGEDAEVPQKCMVDIDGGRLPSKLPPVPRTRELQVEEFTSDRLLKQTYNDSRGVIRTRRVTTHPTNPPVSSRQAATPRDVTADESSYNGDNDQTDEETYGTDSISALSDVDTGFHKARKRALNKERGKDPEMAAAIARGKLKSEDWTQSDLDKFISRSDWNTVTDYIAHMRDKGSNKHDRRSKTKDLPPAAPLQKRIGSRSQLQHTDLRGEVNSVSSWESYSSEESDDYSSYYSESEDDRPRRSRRSARSRREEFAC